MARNMSQSEINHRKKVQGAVSRTTSTLGLGGLAMLGGSVALKKNPGVLRKVPKYSKLTDGAVKAKATKLGDTSRNVGVVSGGVGGIGGYNFASYTAAESRQKKAAVKKNDEDWYDTPTFGDIYEAEPTD